MEISDKYNPNTVEKKWYQYWTENSFFSSYPDERPPYTVVIPPPNVTGILHMGHMLNNTIQDVLIRRARMRGFNACWVPGTDHASIATEAKVVAKLKSDGISKNDIGREKFLEQAWQWTHQYGGSILEQLKKLGCSCDWDRTRFTMEESLSKAVIKAFVKLYNKGLIYRDYKMINWDPEAKTNISDEEVIYKEHNGKLYFLKYKIAGSDEFLSIATTRPETIFGDTAVCVNPDDERYKHLVGKKVIVPIIGREVPIIADEYVDINFGTGILKITPAQDIADYEIGKRHNLEIIDSLDENASLNKHGMHYAGKDRFVVRKEISEELKNKELLIKSEDYINKVGTSERTGAVIEPRISVQWFLKMKDIAKPAINAVKNNDIKFHPEKFKNTFFHWMENVHDWNISRQLWWGHRIPAYYFGDGEHDFVVAENIDQALNLAREKTKNPNLSNTDLKQDEDALDTWFSSWLWPISVFDGFEDNENSELNYYYPTSDLVTGPDIIFFWVARMIMAGLEFKGKIPFKNVYFTGIVRDKQRRKMSKSLGNSPDPVELMDKYGSDGVRVGILMSSAAGNDLLFDEDLMIQGRNFATKIWNAFKLTQSWSIEETEETNESLQAIYWFEQEFYKSISEINSSFDKFRISEALHIIYKLIWDDFCSWYLEIIKPKNGKFISRKVYEKTIEFFEDLMKLLHPFMPFITEEIWQLINPRKTSEALIITQQNIEKYFDTNIIDGFYQTKEIISNIRNYRQTNNISMRESLEVFCNTKKINNEDIIKKLTNISQIHYSQKPESQGFTFLVGATEFVIPLSDNINIEGEKNKIIEEIEYLKGFLKSVEKKLNNEKFMSNAVKNVVDNEIKKQKDTLEKLSILEKKLYTL